MKWKPFTSGKPYTCKDCPAYTELKVNHDKWRSLAENIMRWSDPPNIPADVDPKYREALLAYYEAVRGERPES